MLAQGSESQAVAATQPATLFIYQGRPLGGDQPTAPQSPAVTPDTLVPNGVVDYSISAPKLFWHTKPGCTPSIATSPATAGYEEVVSRIAVQGSLSRSLYSHEVDSACGAQRVQL